MLISFALLIAYTQRVAVTIQAGNVVADVVQDLERAIAEARPNRIVPTESSSPVLAPTEAVDVAAVAARCEAEGVAVPVQNAGYVQHIEHEALVIAAERAGVVIQLELRAGQFVMPGATLALVYPASGLLHIEQALVDGVRLGRHRTLRQDLEFGIAQVVEIALRALSPAINDTFTGLTCVDWLGEELRALALLPPSDWAWRSSNGQVRLIEVPLLFPRMAKSAFDPIRQSSAGNPAVVIRMCRALQRLGAVVHEPESRRALHEQVIALKEMSGRDNLASADHADIEHAAQLAMAALSDIVPPKDVVGTGLTQP